MSDIVGAKVKMNTTETAVDAALSEAYHTKIGANINKLIDDDTTETAARIAGDAAITADVLSTVKGAGPFQTLTQTKTRLDNVGSTILFVQTGLYKSGDPPFVGTDAAGAGPKYSDVIMDSSTGIWRMGYYTGSSPSIVFTTLWSSGLAVATWQIAFLSTRATGSNIFFDVTFMNIAGV